MKEQFKQLSLTWFRAAASAAIALYLAGETDVKVLGTAALAGFLGPVLKWLDPSAKEFGKKKQFVVSARQEDPTGNGGVLFFVPKNFVQNLQYFVQN